MQSLLKGSFITLLRLKIIKCGACIRLRIQKLISHSVSVLVLTCFVAKDAPRHSIPITTFQNELSRLDMAMHYVTVPVRMEKWQQKNKWFSLFDARVALFNPVLDPVGSLWGSFCDLFLNVSLDGQQTSDSITASSKPSTNCLGRNVAILL